jgi:hypothetical protein
MCIFALLRLIEALGFSSFSLSNRCKNLFKLSNESLYLSLVRYAEQILQVENVPGSLLSNPFLTIIVVCGALKSSVNDRRTLSISTSDAVRISSFYPEEFLKGMMYQDVQVHKKIFNFRFCHYISESV